MKKKYNSIQEQIINTCELPKDVFLGASLISVIGNREIVIENFKHIIKYVPEKILIQCKHNQIVIIGEHLSVDCYSKEEIKISGNFTEIKFLKGVHQ